MNGPLGAGPDRPGQQLSHRRSAHRDEPDIGKPLGPLSTDLDCTHFSSASGIAAVSGLALSETLAVRWQAAEIRGC